MAHIEKRGPKRWKARYRDPDGKERSQTFERKVDAENWLTGVEGDKLRQVWIDPSLAKTSFGDWTARWWETTATLKPKTRSGYEGLLRTLVCPGSAPRPCRTSARLTFRSGLPSSSLGVSAHRAFARLTTCWGRS